MKNKVLSAITIILLLVLDWAAINDLIKGDETSYMAEYMILFVSVIVFAVMLIFSLFKKKKENPVTKSDEE